MRFVKDHFDEYRESTIGGKGQITQRTRKNIIYSFILSH